MAQSCTAELQAYQSKGDNLAFQAKQNYPSPVV